MSSNRTRYFFWTFVWLLGISYAQITVPSANNGGGCSTGVSATTCNAPNTATANVAVGDTIIAVHAGSSTSTVIPTPSGCGLTWGAPVVRATATNVNITVWVVAHATTAETGCNINISTANNLNGQNAFTWQIYQNVISIGTPLTSTSQVTNATTISAPTINAAKVGNWVIGLFATSTANAGPYTAVPPTVYRRVWSAVQIAGVAMADIAATSAGESATVTLTPAVAINNRSVSIELVGTPENRTAHLNDAMQTIVMNASHSMNYVLDNTTLSPTWCTWFMPTGSGSNTYELEPASTQINGQAGHVRIPSWQMTRICQDASGNFWASPPLLAGTGISITPAATGLTISAGAGGMTYIAGGTTHLPGSVSVPQGDCANWGTAIAPGVLDTDVVSWSMQAGTATSGWAGIVTRAYPSTNLITWRNCNSWDVAYAPVARDVNWYVLRHTTSAVAAKHRKVTHKEEGERTVGPKVRHKVARPKK